MQKDELLKKLQFFTSKNILTPRNIYFFPIDLFYLSASFLEYLEQLSFFDNNPFFDEESYLGYEGFIFQQYLILFCTGQDSNRLEKYETLKPIIDYKSPDFSEKLLRLIEVTKTKSAEELKTFFKFTQLILTENNYQELLEKLEQKFSLSDESDIFLLLKS